MQPYADSTNSYSLQTTHTPTLQTAELITTDKSTQDSLGFVSYGFDVFTAELSSSPILDTNFSESELKSVAESGSYSYDQFKFDHDYASFSKFVERV